MLLVSLILLLAVVVVLCFMSIIDYLEHKVRMYALVVLWVLSSLYAISSFSSWIMFGSLAYLVMIFLPLCWFGMGWGDFFVLTGLWCFFVPIESLWLFLIIFIMVWFVVVVVVLFRPGTSMKSMKQLFFMHSIPLLPVVCLSFVLWSLSILF